MKVLFAGPSLYGTGWSTHRATTLDCRAPAGQGDIARAAIEGAAAIGLIDGRYEDIAAVWHKEILFALEQGVEVYGAASMGALRAAECAAFGMVGMGAVFERYHSGELADDAAVAQLHGPEELDHIPLTEALVNVEATIGHFRRIGAISDAEAERLDASARELFFKERTYRRILAHAGLNEGERGETLAELMRTRRVDVKRQDALALHAHMEALQPQRRPPPDWRVEPTATWLLTLKRAREFAAAGKDGDRAPSASGEEATEPGGLPRSRKAAPARG